MKPAQIIGNKIAELRRQTGATLDHVATAARSCGLSWGRSTVGDLEAGTKRLTAEELLLMPYVVWRAFPDTDLDLADLLTPMDTDPDQGWLDLTPTARIKHPGVELELTGEYGPSTMSVSHLLDVPFTRERERLGEEQMERVRELRALLKWNVSMFVVRQAIADAANDAERKAARGLGVPADLVAAAAHKRWGHGLTTERDRRVDELAADKDRRSVQALRGHVTRQLVAELEPTLAPHRKGH